MPFTVQIELEHTTFCYVNKVTLVTMPTCFVELKTKISPDESKAINKCYQLKLIFRLNQQQPSLILKRTQKKIKFTVFVHTLFQRFMLFI